MSELLKLAERCEQATEPDGSHDFAIERAVFPGRFGIIEVEGDGLYREWDDDLNDWYDARATQFTASLDAAMTLVDMAGMNERGFYFTLEQDWFDNDDDAWTARFDQRGDECGYGAILATAATPALAICAAALKARTMS